MTIPSDTTPVPLLPPSIHRNKEVQAAYIDHVARKEANDDTSCDMCRLIQTNPLEINFHDNITGSPFNSRNLTYTCVITNEYPYNVYDGRHPTSHHMLVPKEHYPQMSSLPEEVKQELRNTHDTLLDNGIYDGSFTRSTYSATSSVPAHLHIHLIKLGPAVIKQHYDAAAQQNEVEFETENR